MMFLLLYIVLCKPLFSLLCYFLFLYPLNQLTQTTPMHPQIEEVTEWPQTCQGPVTYSFIRWKGDVCHLQKEQLLLLLVAFLFMQGAVRLSTWMSVDSMYAESQVTWFWQSPAVTLLLPSSAWRRTEAGGGGARSTLSARQRSRRRQVAGLFTTTYILTDSKKDREHVKQNSDDPWGWEAVSFLSKKRVW